MTLDPEASDEVMEGVALVANAPKLMQILDAVSAVYRIGKMDMMSVRRQSHIVSARQAFAWLARHLSPRTDAEVARFLANRDPSTITHGVSHVNRRLTRHKAQLREVCKRLGCNLKELE